MKHSKRILSLVLAMVMLLSLGAITASADEGDGKVLNIGAYTNYFVSSLEMSGVDAIASVCSYGIAGLTMDTLFYPTESGEMASDIVESYEYSDDFMTLTLKLKDGVTFASGDPLTGEDVLFSLACKQTSAKPAYYVCIDVDQCTVSDDGLTVTLVYKYPFGPGIRYLDFYIVNKSHYEELAPDGDYSKVDWYQIDVMDGSGPYKLVEMTQDSYAKVVKRDDYWGDASRFSADEINLNVYTDQTTMYIDFENGVLDLALNIASNDAVRLQDGGVEGGELAIIPSNAVVMMCMNENNEYLADINVRQAIAHALDTQVLADACLGIYGTPADSTLARNLSAYVGGLNYEYDPDLSRQLLADAGYTDGQIVLHYITNADTEQNTLAEMVQSMLGAIGITVEMEVMDMGSMMPALMQGMSDFQRQTSSDGNPQQEPLEVYSAFAADSVFPAVAISDPDINAKLDEGYQNVDPEVRDAAYREVQQMIFDGCWVIPLYEWNAGVAVNTNVISDLSILSVRKPDLRWITLN